MSTALTGIDRLIESRPGVQGGQPCVAQKGVTVYWIAHLALAEGLTPEQMIRDVFDGRLTLAEVHAALSFYFQNRATIDADVAERDRRYDEHAASAESLADSQRA